MEQLKYAIRQMIDITDTELNYLLAEVQVKQYNKKAAVSVPNTVPNHIYFINSGTLRLIITDNAGNEHTTHFAIENQFVADYSAFMLQQTSVYTLQAIEDTEVCIIPRAAIEWGYQNLKQGDRLGRLIAEYYFVYQDNRIKNMYARTPKERYDLMADIFPGIHNRAPQHMIASYLGITPIHLSRLKKQAAGKL